MSANLPLVSVVLPVYNENPIFLEQAISSILSQTFTDIEIIIVDDGSCHNETIETIKYFSRSDNRIKCIRIYNQGVSKARNVGISLAKGKYICMADSDDWSESYRIEKQVNYLEKNKSISILGTNAMYHQSNGNILWVSCFPLSHKNIMEYLKDNCGSPFVHGSICFPKEYAVTVGGYREFFTSAGDYDFCWRLCQLSEGVNLPDVLYHYRFKTNSIMGTKRAKDYQFLIIIQQLAEMRDNGLPEDWEQAKHHAEKLLQGQDIEYLSLIKCADHAMLSGYYKTALSTSLSTIIKNPSYRIGYLKFIRLLIFILFPFLRKKLF